MCDTCFVSKSGVRKETETHRSGLKHLETLGETVRYTAAHTWCTGRKSKGNWDDQQRVHLYVDIVVPSYNAIHVCILVTPPGSTQNTRSSSSSERSSRSSSERVRAAAAAVSVEQQATCRCAVALPRTPLPNEFLGCKSARAAIFGVQERRATASR